MKPTLSFALPDDLAAPGLGLRPEAEDDEPFLFALFSSTRDDLKIGLAGLPPEQLATLIRHQFHAQREHYRLRIEQCRFDIVTEHGDPIGRLCLQQLPGRLHLVDMALMPQRRGAGIGTAIVAALRDHALATGRPFSLRVERPNPAQRLYQRAGLIVVAEDELRFDMEIAPNAPALS